LTWRGRNRSVPSTHMEESPMATKKRRKAKKPAAVVGTVKAGKASISQAKLKKFLASLEKKGIKKPKVRFVALNAPFMRRSPV
jgi:hypothetical protein